mgnify:CR=1 FL=1
MELMKTSIKAILDNIICAEEFLDEDAINEFEEIIMNSKNVFVTGAGRSGLAAKAFAMRLMHLGISSYVVGETISPAIYDDDCIIAISGNRTGTGWQPFSQIRDRIQTSLFPYQRAPGTGPRLSSVPEPPERNPRGGRSGVPGIHAYT